MKKTSIYQSGLSFSGRIVAEFPDRRFRFLHYFRSLRPICTLRSTCTLRPICTLRSTCTLRHSRESGNLLKTTLKTLSSCKQGSNTISILLFFLFSELAFSSPVIYGSPVKKLVFKSSLPQLAYSGAGIASLRPDFSYLINPALLGYVDKQRSLLAYSFKSHWQTILFSLLDQTTGIPMSVTFQREWHSQGEYSPMNLWSFSVGSRMTSHFSLGLTARRAKDWKGKNRWNGDVGALLKLGRQTALGMTLSEVLVYESQNHRKVNFGFYQGWTHFLSGRVDVSYSREQEWVVRGGMESLVQKFLALRVGGLWSFKEERALFSGGAGFHGPRLQFDYALQTDQIIFQHVVTAKLLF